MKFTEETVLGILRTEGRSYFLLKKFDRHNQFLVTPTIVKDNGAEPYFSFPRTVETNHYAIEYIGMQDKILVEIREEK
jgi:hypothetical protein